MPSIRALWPGRVIPALVAVLTAGLAILAIQFSGSTQPSPGPAPAAAHPGGPAGVSGAYGYPQRCLSITILADYPTYARADFDHTQLCGRYTGYTTAIFHRVDGAWRVVLDTTAYSCPVAAIPARLQAELGVCDVPDR